MPLLNGEPCVGDSLTYRGLAGSDFTVGHGYQILDVVPASNTIFVIVQNNKKERKIRPLSDFYELVH